MTTSENTPPIPNKTTLGQQAFLVCIVLLAFAVAYGLAYTGYSKIICWIWLIFMILVFIGCLGKCTLGRWAGIFINERNLMSLSRMQIVAWTVLIVSALLVMVLYRLAVTVTDPFDITIPQEIWAVLGLSATAAVGAPMINTIKSVKEPLKAPDSPEKEGTVSYKEADPAPQGKTNNYPPAVKRAAVLLREEPADIEANRKGILYANKSPADARFTDIFEGDELENVMYNDISKVQMFWFSVVAIGGYAILILSMFLNATTADQLIGFPAFSAGFTVILGVSHATYLGGKSYTQTKSTG